MKTGDIIRMESENQDCVNLVRNRLFWQAWEMSAFHFVTHLRAYRLHKRNYRNVGMELVYLGFPDPAIADILKEAEEKNSAIDSALSQVSIPN